MNCFIRGYQNNSSGLKCCHMITLRKIILAWVFVWRCNQYTWWFISVHEQECILLISFYWNKCTTSKHFDNYGRFNLSVADSSYDTRLWRLWYRNSKQKTSIYDEGCLHSIDEDLLIRSKSNGQYSLDEVMRTLYRDFGKRKISYTEHDYLSIMEKLSGESMADFFGLHIRHGKLSAITGRGFGLVGCQLLKRSSVLILNDILIQNNSSGWKNICETSCPASVADLAGLGKDEEINQCQWNESRGQYPELLHLFKGEKIILTTYSPLQIMKTLHCHHPTGVFSSLFHPEKKTRSWWTTTI